MKDMWFWCLILLYLLNVFFKTANQRMKVVMFKSLSKCNGVLGKTDSLISQPSLLFVICCCPALLHRPLLSLDLPDTSDQSLTREDEWAAAQRKIVECVCLRLQRGMCLTCGSLTPFRPSGLWCQSLCYVCEFPLLLEVTSQIIFTLVWDL